MTTPGSAMRVSALAVFALLLPFVTAFDPIHSPSGAVAEGNAHMKAGKPSDALAAYDKAVAELPSEPGVHFDRGTALAALSRFDEAGEEFLRATEAKEPSLKAAAFYNLGNAFTKKEKLKEAIEAYKRALALDPKDERAKWNLEIALKKKRDDDKKKEDEKQNDDKDKDKKKNDQKDKDKKDEDKKQDDQKQDEKKQDKKDKDKLDQPKPKDEDKKDKAVEPPPPPEKPSPEREIESTLDNLEKSPKDLEKQRAMLRAVRRAPPTRDW